MRSYCWSAWFPLLSLFGENKEVQKLYIKSIYLLAAGRDQVIEKVLVAIRPLTKNVVLKK